MSYLPDGKVTHLVIHYSATPIENNYTAADIDRMHRNRGFRKIGYHYFIRKNGVVEAGRDLTQPGRFEMGAHSQGENDQSIGICYEGGVRASAPNVGFDSRTPQQKRAMEKLIRELLNRFPGAIVEGHRDMPGAATQCPGFDARAWWDSVADKAPSGVSEEATDEFVGNIFAGIMPKPQAPKAPSTEVARWRIRAAQEQAETLAATLGAALEELPDPIQ